MPDAFGERAKRKCSGLIIGLSTMIVGLQFQWPIQGGGPGGPGPPLLKIPKMEKRVPPVENEKNGIGGPPFVNLKNVKGPH